MWREDSSVNPCSFSTPSERRRPLSRNVYESPERVTHDEWGDPSVWTETRLRDQRPTRVHQRTTGHDHGRRLRHQGQCRKGWRRKSRVRVTDLEEPKITEPVVYSRFLRSSVRPSFSSLRKTFFLVLWLNRVSVSDMKEGREERKKKKKKLLFDFLFCIQNL